MSTVSVRVGLGLAYPPAVRDLRWAAAGLVLVTALVGGCSEKQEANDSLPTATASRTEDQLPPLGPEDLPMPDEARTQDAAGAEALREILDDQIDGTWSLHLAAAGLVTELVAPPRGFGGR